MMELKLKGGEGGLSFGKTLMALEANSQVHLVDMSQEKEEDSSFHDLAIEEKEEDLRLGTMMVLLGITLSPLQLYKKINELSHVVKPHS